MEENKRLIWAADNEHEIALSFLPKGKCKVLDAGCGPGALSYTLKSKGYDVVSADIENNLKFDDLNFFKLDLNKKLPLPKNSFDCIICVEVIEHLESPRFTIKEFKKILKKGLTCSLYMTTFIMYEVKIKKKVLKRIERMPYSVQEKMRYLVMDLRDKGPLRKEWPNFSKLGEDIYHCHLAYRWVACWRCGKNSIIIEVYYAGSRENAPY